jgi:hypothetical protein
MALQSPPPHILINKNWVNFYPNGRAFDRKREGLIAVYLYNSVYGYNANSLEVNDSSFFFVELEDFEFAKV